MDPSGIFGLFTSQVGQQQQQQYNREQRNEQNRLNLQQWSRENAYNTPSAQMARYADAGLNPNLIYGQQNTSAQSPMLTGGQPMDFSPYAQLSSQALLQSAQIENLRSQSNLNNKEAGKFEADTKGLVEQYRLLKAKNDELLKVRPRYGYIEVTDSVTGKTERKPVGEFLSLLERQITADVSKLESDSKDSDYTSQIKQVQSILENQYLSYLYENKGSLEMLFESRLKAQDASNAEKYALSEMLGLQAEAQKYINEQTTVFSPEVRAWVDLLLRLVGGVGSVGSVSVSKIVK